MTQASFRTPSDIKAYGTLPDAYAPPAAPAASNTITATTITPRRRLTALSPALAEPLEHRHDKAMHYTGALVPPNAAIEHHGP
ncbi:hypothetical protein GCM10009554_43830 [Kribbella koreensis]|uniref:Uncharacterized protein n=1 Tax=Kribbella koreensis TaxID=57909 RepID=A0ABP4BCV4_9ACTN